MIFNEHKTNIQQTDDISQLPAHFFSHICLDGAVRAAYY